MSELSSALLISLFVGILCMIPVAAHPPGTIDLSYDSGTGILNVTILHEVNDSRDHYIREVMIEIPDNPVKRVEYTSQPDPREFTYSYPIPVSEWATLKVTAVCSSYGSLSRTIQNEAPGAGGRVGSGNTGSDSQGSSSAKTANSPGLNATGVVIVLVCTMILISLRK